jgi:hypothetical protein
MKSYCPDIPDGYRETISEGMKCIGFLDGKLTRGTGSVQSLKEAMDRADAIVIGAGAGLSTSAGLTYSGERFKSIFSDFHDRYGITDMYSGGFYPFPSPEIMWAWWSRHIYFNRYVDPPKSVYRDLLSILEGKDYFVITTNVDHQFQRAGFDKQRLFYTQGDYGLFQSTNRNNRRTYDNEKLISKMLESQGFVKDETGLYRIPADGVAMSIDPELKMNRHNMGKYLIRKAFADDHILPDEILWRQKAAFSDAVGHSMVNDLKAYAEKTYTDKEFEEKASKYDYCRPFTKESLLYRELFEQYYPGQAHMIPDFWMPNKTWPGCDVDDPSARVLANYGDSGV